MDAASPWADRTDDSSVRARANEPFKNNTRRVEKRQNLDSPHFENSRNKICLIVDRCKAPQSTKFRGLGRTTALGRLITGTAS